MSLQRVGPREPQRAATNVTRPSHGSLAMISLRIHHRTTYRYRSPVGFGQHRLMLRPRESRELRLTAFELTVTPQASVSWAHDVWGNAVATRCLPSHGRHGGD